MSGDGKSGDDSFDGFGESDYEEKLDRDLQDAENELSKEQTTFVGPGGAAWGAATDIVHRVRPVPWLLWVVIRAVYGKSGELGDPPSTAFSVVSNLITHAATDRTLAHKRKEEDGTNAVSLSESVNILGSDVAASILFLHAVCRRVSTTISERVWRPIVDDALLRAHIGYHVGELSPSFGPGRGMLAGFAGRCGLSIQIASGSMEQAQKALSGLAAGIEISQICREVYRCDPLQVAALALIAGGCSRDIAMGIAAYSNTDTTVIPGSEQHRWLTAFSVIEQVRMGRKDGIAQDAWRLLGYDAASINELFTRVQQVQRRGHGWRWMTQALIAIDATPKKLDKGEKEPV